MKLISVAAVVCSLQLCSADAFGSSHIDTVYKFGVNWQEFDTTLANGQLRSETEALGFNIFHGELVDPNFPAITADKWIHSGSGTPQPLILSNRKGAISRYSGYGAGAGGGEFMKFVAVDTPGVFNSASRLQRFFFLRKSAGTTYPHDQSPENQTHWEVPVSTSDHSSVVVLDSSEILAGRFAYQCNWTGATSVPFKLAIMM